MFTQSPCLLVLVLQWDVLNQFLVVFVTDQATALLFTDWMVPLTLYIQEWHWCTNYQEKVSPKNTPFKRRQLSLLVYWLRRSSNLMWSQENHCEEIDTGTHSNKKVTGCWPVTLKCRAGSVKGEMAAQKWCNWKFSKWKKNGGKQEWLLLADQAKNNACIMWSITWHRMFCHCSPFGWGHMFQMVN